jgi:hypothetical protein
MDATQELFERFGKLFIERVRDLQIGYVDAFLEQTSPQSAKYKAELDAMSPEQIEMLKIMGTHWVDATLHDLLFVLEGAYWIHLRLESENTILEDIRRATSGDLQGYIDIWAEKYSKKRLPSVT